MTCHAFSWNHLLYPVSRPFPHDLRLFDLVVFSDCHSSPCNMHLRNKNSVLLSENLLSKHFSHQRIPRGAGIHFWPILPWETKVHKINWWQFSIVFVKINSTFFPLAMMSHGHIEILTCLETQWLLFWFVTLLITKFGNFRKDYYYILYNIFWFSMWIFEGVSKGFKLTGVSVLLKTHIHVIVTKIMWHSHSPKSKKPYPDFELPYSLVTFTSDKTQGECNHGCPASWSQLTKQE